MKASDTPKIDKAWWSKNKPLTLKSTGLGEAMASFQDAKAAALKLAAKGPMDYDGTIAAFDKADLAFVALEGATKKAISACNKTLHADCIVVLNKLLKPGLPTEERALAGELHRFEGSAQGEAARVKGVCETMAARSTKLANDAEEQFDKLSKLEDDLADIRDAAARAKQSGATVDKKEVERAKQIATAVEAATRTLKSDLQKMRKSVNDTFKEVFDPSLAKIDKSLSRMADRIAMPMDIIDEKFVPQFESAAARARKAATGIEGLASGSADMQAEYLDMMEGFVERGIRRSDGISGNLRSAGGKLDGADQSLMNYEEAKGHGDKALVANASKLLKEGIQEIKITDTNLKAFKKSVEDFGGKMPPFVNPKTAKFREPLGNLVKLNEGIEADADEIKKLSNKATKVGTKLKGLLSTVN